MREGKVGAIIVAAGQSKRMQGRDKIFAQLAGKPLLARVVEVFQECEVVDQMVIVLSRQNLELGKELAAKNHWTKVKAICLGGERRQDSVREGLKRLANCRWVIVHDGARPLLTRELIEKGLAEAQESGAAIAAVPVKETIKRVSPEGFVQETPRRDNLWIAQTPQVFDFDLLVRAHEQINEEVSDDAMLVEKLGHKVKLYLGSYENIKVTTPEDLALAEFILNRKETK